MEGFLRYFPLIYFAAVFFFAFFLRSYLTWRRTGVNPYRLGSSDSAHDYIGKMFRLIYIAIGGVVVIYAVWPEGYAYLAPIVWLERTPLFWFGIGILIGSFALVLIAQAQMGASWRIGIDGEVKTPLVNRGLFSLSRNPIFLGMRLMLLGLFLVMPNAATLAILLVSEVLIQIQVRLEEEFLSRTHGVIYEEYRRTVRRWL